MSCVQQRYVWWIFLKILTQGKEKDASKFLSNTGVDIAVLTTLFELLWSTVPSKHCVSSSHELSNSYWSASISQENNTWWTFGPLPVGSDIHNTNHHVTDVVQDIVRESSKRMAGRVSIVMGGVAQRSSPVSMINASHGRFTRMVSLWYIHLQQFASIRHN